MQRAALYIRVSTEEQALHGLSIEAQREALDAWANANHVLVVDHYVDAGISARKPAAKRPELQRLLCAVRAGEIDLIVFTKLDRWFRSVSDYYKVQDILDAHKVHWKTIHEDYETVTASGRLKINIMLSVAQDEADRTSERIKSINQMKRQKLEPLTGQMPFGYISDGKKIVKDPKTEEAVDTFFRSLLASGSVSVAQRDVFEQCGVALNYQRAHKMMKSTAYCGRYFDVDGMTPPYLTVEEYKQVHGLIKKIVRKSPKNHVFLFSGLIICSECGRRMGTRRSTMANYYYYACPAPYTTLKECSNRTCINEKDIERYLLDTLDEKIREKKEESEVMQAARKGNNYKQEIAAVRGKLGRLKELYINDLITMDEFKADHDSLMNRLNELIEMDKPDDLQNLEALETALEPGWKEKYADLAKEAKREVWRSIIRKIIAFPDRHIEFELRI